MEVFEYFASVNLSHVQLALQLIHVLCTEDLSFLLLSLHQDSLIVQIEVLEPLPKDTLAHNHAFHDHLLQHLEYILERFNFSRRGGRQLNLIA